MERDEVGLTMRSGAIVAQPPDAAYAAVLSVLPEPPTLEQHAALTEILRLHREERADQDTAFELWPGEGKPEYAAAEARSWERRQTGAWHAAWGALFAAFGHSPPDGLVAAVQAHGWGPDAEELDEFSPEISGYDPETEASRVA